MTKAKAFLLLGALVAAGVATVPVAADEPPASRLDALRALALERSGGDLDRLGTITIHRPDGVEVRPVTGREFLAWSAEMLARFGYGTEAASPDKGIGFGIDNARIAQRTGWPFCDYATMFVDGPAVLVRADPWPTGDVAAGPLCGGFYGGTHTWQDITLYSPEGNGCIAALVMTRPEPQAGLIGGYACGAHYVSLHGNGVLVQLEFFGIEYWSVLGGTAVVMAGSSQL